jgi:hypothetical protein
MKKETNVLMDDLKRKIMKKRGVLQQTLQLNF